MNPKVLSIQSHVVSGYVGNKCAVFPLQLLGFEVDSINSVQFSNHTGYEHIKGQVLTDLDLGDLTDGLAANHLDTGYTHLLTGYIGSKTFLERIVALVKHLKVVNKNLIYFCDPVMGDDGKMYVPEELLPVYRELIIPLADIMTPNQYEVELLTGIKVNCIEDAWKAIDILHEMGCKTVVISSSQLADDKSLLCLASSTVGGSKQCVSIETPKLEGKFTGTGDLFASLFLAWMYKSNSLSIAIEKTVSTLQSVLKRTIAYAKDNGMNAKNMELKLIQSKKEIEDPVVLIKSKIL